MKYMPGPRERPTARIQGGSPVGSSAMPQAIRVRAIEYTTLSHDMADVIGLSPSEVKVQFGELTDMAVVKCVDTMGRKLTAVGDPDDLRDLLIRGGPGRTDDLELTRSRWPVLLRGWLQAS